MATREPQRVSAADFIRGFANWRLQSARKPVVVTHHGKDAHVLISLDDYRRLDGESAAAIATKANMLRDSLAALVESVRDGVILVDRHRRIAALNPAAADMLEAAATDLVGLELVAALPRLDDTLLMPHIARLIDYRERFSGDIPGLLRPNQWLHVDLVPLAVGGAIVMHDVSDALDAYASDNGRRGLAIALEADGGIGHARISVRETVEDANEALTAMVGTDPAAIRRVRFSALLAVGQRQRFVAALESVFRTGEPARIASELVSREGAIIPVSLSIAELRGAYASEGAAILVTRRQDAD